MNNIFYVYWIVGLDNEPFYVGKSKKRKGYNRLRHHIWLARTGRHHNKPLQARLLREEYSMVIKAENLSEDDALTIERSHIQKFGMKKDGGVLLNLTDSNQSSDWSPSKITNRREHELKKNKGRPVAQYTLEGIHIAEYPSAKRASEATAGNRSYITQVCKGVRKSAGGFMWRYVGDDAPTRYQTLRGRVIGKFDTNGTLVTTYTTCKRIREDGFKFRLVLDCCRGHSNSSQGFVWKYMDH